MYREVYEQMIRTSNFYLKIIRERTRSPLSATGRKQQALLILLSERNFMSQRKDSRPMPKKLSISKLELMETDS